MGVRHDEIGSVLCVVVCGLSQLEWGGVLEEFHGSGDELAPRQLPLAMAITKFKLAKHIRL
jgi:hypothetical protein